LIKVLSIDFRFLYNKGNITVIPPDVVSVIKISVPGDGIPEMRR
jgi:hypothetical protein